MTTEDKLKHFHETSLSSAYEKGSAAISEHKSMLLKKFDEHKAFMLKKAENEFKQEVDSIIRENNDKNSRAHNHIKIEMANKTLELTNKIFDELTSLLNDYKRTDDYKKLLIRQICSIKKQAGPDDELLIYIDPSDSFLLDSLKKEAGCTLIVSENSFIGGIRAVLNQNLLIDYSLLTKIEELRDGFNFDKYIGMYAQ